MSITTMACDASKLPPHKKIPGGVVINDWAVKTTKGTIYNSHERDETEDKLKIPLPEMLFGHNSLKLHHSSGFTISFQAVPALDLVDKKNDTIKVRMSTEWTRKRPNTEINKVYNPFDWTYTTTYKGEIENGENGSVTVESTNEGIDIERLKRPDPIVFFDEVPLFEDELADNGSATLSVKVRVMPSCFLVLQRFFLRVDGVLCRIHDTRVYHQFGKDYLIRDYTAKEDMWSSVNQVKLVNRRAS
eukprot:Colp12_sorted_trinity150504_noHs@4177